MTLRLVQAGTGEQRDVVVIYHLTAELDRRVREAAGSAIVVNDTRPPSRGNEYRVVGGGGIAPLRDTVAWARNVSGALATGRVIVVGYSAGCKAVRTLLLDAGGRQPDAVVTIDGTHATLPPLEWQIEVWAKLAAEARAGERVWIATHTMLTYVEHLKPPHTPYTSTWRVLQRATGWELDPPARRFEGGLQVWSYPGGDHADQARTVLPAALKEALAALDNGVPAGASEARPCSSPPEAPGSASATSASNALEPSEEPGSVSEPSDAIQTEEHARTTVAAAVLARARADLAAGVREHPPGSNRGPEVDASLRALGVQPPASWCAARLTTWIREACAELGVEPPVAGSAGAQALGAQFKTAGRWVGKHAIKREYLIPGNVVVWRRGTPGDWRGHIGIVDEPSALGVDEPGVLLTIEANSGPRGDRVARMARQLSDERLLGIGLLTTPEELAALPPPPAYEPSEHELAELARLLELGAEAISEGEPRDPLADFEERVAEG